MRRIDVWRQFINSALPKDRCKDRYTYIAVSQNSDGAVAWKVCKMDEWRDDEHGDEILEIGGRELMI